MLSLQLIYTTIVQNNDYCSQLQDRIQVYETTGLTI